MESQLPRKLAAVMYTDVVDYARLVGENEDAAHRQLAASLDLMEGQVKAHRGQVVHYAGDALLAKFSAVADSVNCAVEVQKQLAERNADLPGRQRILFRIGLNLGDVIEDRGDIFGDGVNLAARLESRAVPGGICISDAVYQQVNARTDLEFENLGDLVLKNIAGKIHAYRILPTTMPQTSRTFQALTGESLDLPSRASIAVLTFLNISGDIEQEHFADGMAEDIITILSRVPDLVVIARNSTFVYKGHAVDVRQVGRELEVAYVLEGSIRRRGDLLRITAQLVKAQSGEHVWADRFDRALDDIFAIQGEITREIVTALQIELTHGEEIRIRAERATSFEAWELLQRAYAEQLKFTREGNDDARRIIERVLTIDPDYQTARVLLAWVLQTAARFGYISDAEAAIGEAESLARAVIAEDEENDDAHAILCYILAYRSKLDEGIRHGEQAIELGPSSAAAHAALATALYFRGAYEASLARMKKALRLSPYAPDWILAGLGDVRVRYVYDIDVLDIGYSYGLTGKLSIGIHTPYYWINNNVDIEFDNSSANVGRNTGAGDPLIPVAMGGIPLTEDEVQTLISKTFGFEKIGSWKNEGIGDIEFGARYRIDADRDSALAFTGGLRIPTGYEDDADKLNDVAWSYGNYAMLFRLHYDYLLSNRWKPEPSNLLEPARAAGDLLLNLTLRYDYMLPDDKIMRVGDTPGQTFTNNRERVDRKLGDIVNLELSTRYWSSDALSFGATYTYGFKSKDDIDGDLGFNYSSLEADTDFEEQIVIVEADYSTLPAYREQQSPAPMNFSIAYRERFAGEGPQSGQANPRLYTRWIVVGMDLLF